MSLKDFFVRSPKITIEEESCEYLLFKIFNYIDQKKIYKLTNVTPGLAVLLKRKLKGEYLKNTETFILNPRGALFKLREISCKIEDLTALLLDFKKGE